MVLYKEETISELTGKSLKYLLLSLGLLLIGLTPLFIIFFTIDDGTDYDVLRIVFIVVTIISGWAAITVFTVVFLPFSRRKNVVKKILSFGKRNIIGTVISMDKHLTVPEKIYVTEIAVLCDDKRFEFYYDDNCPSPAFSVGDKVDFTLSANFVYSYEVIK